MYPAVGQGALGIECRAEDVELQSLLAQIDHAPTRSRVTAERTLLSQLRAGCHAPVGAATRIERDVLVLEAVVYSADGTERIFASGSAPVSDAEALGRAVADSLLAQGANRLIGN
jgi:hydroxymethylbilane synthase